MPWGLPHPTAIVVGSGNAAKHGILFKDSEALQKTAAINTIVFDKTGTLTYGVPKVTAFEPLADLSAEQALFYAASAEQGSSHPLAHAVVEYAKEKKSPSCNRRTSSIKAGRAFKSL